MDLFDQVGESGYQGAGDSDVGGAFGAGGPTRARSQSLVQDGRVGAAFVLHGGQPGAQAFGGQPVGAVLTVESGQKPQTDRRIQVLEESYRAGIDAFKMLTQLVGDPNSVDDQVFAGPAKWGYPRSLGAFRGQRAQPGPVGPQRVGQHERIESVVFVACRAIAAAQVLDLIGVDDDNGDPRVKQGIDERSVRTFDGHFVGTGARQDSNQLGQTPGAVLDHSAIDRAATAIDNRNRVIVTGPIDPTRDTVDWLVGQHNWGILHDSLLAAEPSGEAPSSVRGVTPVLLTVRRSN